MRVLAKLNIFLETLPWLVRGLTDQCSSQLWQVWQSFILMKCEAASVSPPSPIRTGSVTMLENDSTRESAKKTTASKKINNGLSWRCFWLKPQIKLNEAKPTLPIIAIFSKLSSKRKPRPISGARVISTGAAKQCTAQVVEATMPHLSIKLWVLPFICVAQLGKRKHRAFKVLYLSIIAITATGWHDIMLRWLLLLISP